jgi:hypothetical protein
MFSKNPKKNHPIKHCSKLNSKPTHHARWMDGWMDG